MSTEEKIEVKPLPTDKIELNMREALPIIRKAYDEKRLQMFHGRSIHGKKCCYEGPCAIGICIPEGQRAQFDDYYPQVGTTSFGGWVNVGNFVVSLEEEGDFKNLQALHDSVITTAECHLEYIESCILQFEEFLVELEEKYK